MKISGGSYDVNRWLHGGYDDEIITTIYGSAGSGKTNFCLQAAVSQAKKGNKVIYIDTEGGFSSERVKQLVGNDDKEKEKVLGNILILKPTNFEEQKKSFDSLLNHIKNQVSLIVCDGMTMLYRLDFASAREKSNGNGDISAIQHVNFELTRQMKLLAEISRKRYIPVIVTNQVYSWNDELKMVGGDIMTYWSKCLIELVIENGKRTAFLRKHRYLPDKRFPFTIVDLGIKKRGWI